jgi:predicted ATPase
MIPMNHASSGQQEVMWIFNELFLILLKKEKAFIILEEPEAHIYPRLQLELVKFIAHVVNETGSTIFITTHSPYILTSLNLLCYAGVVAEGKNDTTAVSKLLDGNVLIKPGNVVSVKLEQRGGETIAESLLDDNEELKTEMIDGVSNTINELYTSLYDLEEK